MKCFRAVVLVALAFGALAVGGPATAAAKWSLQPAPSQPGSTNPALGAVSCAAVDACVAVGGDELEDSSSQPFSEIWDGTQWNMVPIPRLEDNGMYFAVGGVSCPSSDHCVAAGTYETEASEGSLPLAEFWDGSEWTPQEIPAPAGSAAQLNGISCSSTEACTAVGTSITGGAYEAFATSWDGSEWTTQSLPQPAGTTLAYLNAVSCASAADCVAVGNYHVGGEIFPFTEVWDGSEWSLQSLPTPSGGNNLSITGVSCVSGNACTVSGTFQKGAPEAWAPAALSWNGSSWSALELPKPAGAANYAFLSGVSCVAATSCTGAGYYKTMAGEFQPMALRLSGSKWSASALPHPLGSTFSILSGISCVAAESCAAVGGIPGESLIVSEL
jgi:hypothetical protein